MQIRAVRFQNFRTFGNELTEIRLDATPATLVVGTNGAGKTSSLLESICFAGWGRPFNPKINKGQLVNSITRKGLVSEIDVRSGGREYTIRRGIKPNFLEVLEHADGQTAVLPAPADVREFQEWIEKNILRMNAQTFRQIVVLGKDTHVPFMRLPAANRREVVEDILNIQVYTVMNQVLKERADRLRSDIEAAKMEVNLASQLVKHRREAAAARNQDTEDLIEGKLLHRREHEIKRDRAMAIVEESEAEARKWSAELEELLDSEEQIAALRDLEQRLLDKLDQAVRQHSFYQSNSTCPTCTQGIEESFRRTTLEANKTKRDKIVAGLEELRAELGRQRERNRKMQMVNAVIADHNKTISANVQAVRMANEFIRAIDEEVEELRKNVRPPGAEDNVSEAEDRLALWNMRLDELHSQALVMGAAGKMLKDDGIKAAEIADYIPEMNRQINHYLGAMDLFVDFHLDENFNEFIRSRHRDEFSYEMFSAGEKLRIDLAILFAWRAIAKIRTGASINLLVFDEILDSSLDDQGIEDFLRVVEGLTGGQNVFIISHKREQLSDKFARTLRFTKRNNFSKLETE